MSGARIDHARAVLQALLVTFLWSTSWVLIKIGLKDIAPLGFAALRYLVAFGILALTLAARAEPRRQLRTLQAADWRRLTLLGVVFYALTQGAQFVALDGLPAVTVSLILSFSPAVVAVLGASLLGERLGGRQWGGVGCFLVGALVYFLPAVAPLHVVGLAAAALGLVANAGSALLGRAVNRHGTMEPLVVTVVSMGVGSLLLAVSALIVEGRPRLDASGWAIVLWLAAVNTAIAFTLWNHTLRHLTAVESSLINNTMMIQIAVLAWLVLGEPIEGRQAVGLALAALGVVFVQLPRGAPRAASD